MKFLYAKIHFWKDSLSGSAPMASKYKMDGSFKWRVRNLGYTFHEYPVLTSDGFRLTVFNIQKKGLSNDAPVVFMQHGFSEDANTFLRQGKNSPAILLANQGFNVFLGNNRGSRYSRTHFKYDPVKDGAKYFDYSFYELGKFDQPAMIDFVRNLTKKDKIGYVGHSQGTT